MKYQVKFPTASLEGKFYKTLVKIPRRLQDEIMDKVTALGDNPYPAGRKIFKRLVPPVRLLEYTASYRVRIGDYRMLYDVNEAHKIVWIYVLRRRNERTY